MAAVHFGLWRNSRALFHATWCGAWTLYALRLGLIAGYISTRADVWLFAHQTVTVWTALLLLKAALQFARGQRWDRRDLVLVLAAPAWAAFAVYGMHNPIAASVIGAVLLSGVTLWTSWEFWRLARRAPSTGAWTLAVTFFLWTLHHLDYPLLRTQGAGILYGVFLDMALIVATAIGTLTLVLGEERRSLQLRHSELEQLTRVMLRSQEEERRRIARELHDEAGQVLTAVKIELDLEGRVQASALVARALEQVRELSNRLRPTALDSLGLLPALMALADDLHRHARITATCKMDEALPLSLEAETVLYRVAQEAFTNVARHSGARTVALSLRRDGNLVRLVVEDDGRGTDGPPIPHLGLTGMRERVAALGGKLAARGLAGRGFRVEAELPTMETA